MRSYFHAITSLMGLPLFSFLPQPQPYPGRYSYAMSDINQARVERWKPVLEKLNDIPTLPVVATRVTELINDPNSSSAEIADVLKKDQVLTAKVLKLIN